MTDDKRLDRPENELPRPERASLEELRDWEQVQVNETDSTERLKVAGGFLYRTIVGSAVALVFVPDE